MRNHGSEFLPASEPVVRVGTDVASVRTTPLRKASRACHPTRKAADTPPVCVTRAVSATLPGHVSVEVLSIILPSKVGLWGLSGSGR